MTRQKLILLSAILMVGTTQRLPAPIQELPGSPTPAATEQPKPRKSHPKSEKIEAEPKTKEPAKPSTASVSQGPARFAGTWSGTINQGILGNIPMTLVIDTGTRSVKEISKVGTFTHPVTANGNMLAWRAGWLSEIAWTFVPNADGKTAAVTSKSPFGVNGSATFRKQ
jgi:hypothetical protein